MHEDYLKKISQLMFESQIICERQQMPDWDEAFSEIISLFISTRKDKKTVFFIGNGGSAAIACHMTADFMKNGDMHTVSLYDNALTTCMGNDYGYEYVFSKPLEFLAHQGDLLVAISSSGNSPNIINAIYAAKKNGARIVTLTGFKDDNIIKDLGDYNIYVPMEHYGMVETIHNMYLQQIVDEIMEKEADVQ